MIFYGLEKEARSQDFHSHVLKIFKSSSFSLRSISHPLLKNPKLPRSPPVHHHRNPGPSPLLPHGHHHRTFSKHSSSFVPLLSTMLWFLSLEVK
ncbi:hypothetical protein L2E82_03688 [Cichorium intybus]|uniref:Uncharacterized protein n=1 Tax=Cichorium intybus TaxID=13427 RepID=A0ACB9H4E2_CICIN|nr:hypothetical protein L2E82_03688 [Cichorium intybus]